MPVLEISLATLTQVIEADGVTVEPPYNGSTGVDYLTATLLLLVFGYGSQFPKLY